MRRFWLFVGVLVMAMLLMFFVFQSFDLPFLAEDTSFMLENEKWVASLAGVGLLVADVIAPVPSSIIMFANGILFGIIWGSVLSLIGGMGAAAVGFWIGAKGEKKARNWMGKDALDRANHFFQRNGKIAVIVSRPIPILAEAVSIVAGMSRMRFKTYIFASFLGYLPAVILYAAAGAYSIDLNTGLFAFLGVMVLATITWLIGRMTMKQQDIASSSK